MNPVPTLAQWRGALLGLLVGDALGVPYEFHPPQALPPRAQIEMQPPDGFRRAHDVPAGTWSDDGAQALCLLASLQYAGRLDLDDFARRLLNWMDHGYLAVDYQVFDVGASTRQALDRLRDGCAAEHAGGIDEFSNGNGSLMRVLPLALWHRGSDAELAQDAHRQSLPTHGHPRAQACCALYCLWARRLLTGADTERAFADAAEQLQAIYAADAVFAEQRQELAEILDPANEARASGSGYVVDSLWSARIALREGNYADVVRRAIAFGHDTDTTACIAGGLAGIRFGEQGIPPEWLAALRGRDWLSPLLDRLDTAD